MTAVREALGPLRIVWFGVRGIDSAALHHLAVPVAVVSLTAPTTGLGAASEFCMEAETLRRVDLNMYDVDGDGSDDAGVLRAFARACTGLGRLLIQYRSAAFLEEFGLAFPPAILGPPHRVQRLFEAKPWVEQELRAIRVPVIDWQPQLTNETTAVARLLSSGPVAVRSGLGAGGARMHLIRTLAEYQRLRTGQESDRFWLARFIDGLPLNVNACVYKDGHVRTFGVSLQLIGIPSCTTRPLGYCGNDFAAAARALDSGEYGRVASLARRIGRWMRSFGYVGLFGVDLVLSRDGPIVAEVNPRFQGSTPLAAEVCRAVDQPEPFSEHVAACLGLEPPRMLSDSELARRVTRLSSVAVAQAIFYNTSGRSQYFPLSGGLPGMLAQPAKNVIVEPHGMWCKFVFREPVTRTGYELDGAAVDTAHAVRAVSG